MFLSRFKRLLNKYISRVLSFFNPFDIYNINCDDIHDDNDPTMTQDYNYKLLLNVGDNSH